MIGSEDMKIKIVTDSTCNLPSQLLKKYDISVVDLKVMIDDEVFKDSKIKPSTVVDAIKSGKDVRTSQPSVEDFTNIYEKALKKYDYIISIHLSSKLSGTINAANLAVKNLDAEDQIIVFDTRIMSLAMGLIVLKASELVRQYSDIDVILKELENYTETTKGYFMVGNLDSLIKGGRIGKIRGKIATLLRVKPIFTVIDGEIDIFKITLGKKRGLSEMIDLVKRSREKIRDKFIAITYLNTEKIIKKVVEELGRDFKYLIAPTVPSLAVHAGTELFAVVFNLKT